MEKGFRKIDSLILDGPSSFDDEDEAREPLSPEEREALIVKTAKICGVSEERFRQMLAHAGV